MAWTPPSKGVVILSFLLTAFGIFILLDQSVVLWVGTYLPVIHLTPSVSSFQSWMIIGVIVFFFSWFLFFLGVKLKGM